jgi:hypothetical protein
MLTLLARGMNDSVGMIIRIPATIAQEGQVLASIEPFTEYVGGLRPGNLTLQYAYTETEAPQEPARVPIPQALTKATTLFPLQITSSYRSAGGTVSTYQARVATWTQQDLYPHVEINTWLATAISIPIRHPSALKKALARCLPFVNKGGQEKGKAQELEGILVHLDTDSIAFSAATRTMLICSSLPLDHPISSSCTGLFYGKAFSGIKEALSQETIRLTLAHDEATHTMILLFSTESLTWFCRSMDMPPPGAWTRTLSIPHEAEWLIERQKLIAPLKFFAGPVATTYQALSLVMEEQTLTLSMLGCDDTTIQETRTIHVLHASAARSILVNPKQFKALVHAASGDLLHLQIGHFHRQEGEKSTRVDFLRVVSEQTIGIMSLSQKVSPSPASTPASEQEASVALDTSSSFAFQEA